MCEHEGTGWGKRHDEILIYCKLIILLADWPTVVLVSGDGWMALDRSTGGTDRNGRHGERNAFIWAGFCTWHNIHPISIAQPGEHRHHTETTHLPELAFNIKTKENTLKIHDFLEQCVLMIITQLHTSDDTSLKISSSFRVIEATETKTHKWDLSCFF